MHDLVVVENLTPSDVFTDNGADSIIDRIEKEARSALIDISTDTGRKECASIAYKIARSKTFLDDMGKELVADWKGKSAKVDAERRKIRDRLDALKDEVRKPLTDFENAEKTRIEEHENQIATIQAFGVLQNGSCGEIETNLKAVSEIMQRDWQEFGKRATDVADEVRKNLNTKLIERQKYDSDQAELESLRKRQEERDRADREAKIKAEAEEAATLRAQQEIAASKAREEAAIQGTIEAKEKADRDVKEAAAKAERDTQAAIEAERTRVAKAKADDDAAAVKREADHKHKAKINREALAAISIAASITEEAAKPIVEAIARGAIPQVTIRY